MLSLLQTCPAGLPLTDLAPRVCQGGGERNVANLSSQMFGGPGAKRWECCSIEALQQALEQLREEGSLGRELSE